MGEKTIGGKEGGNLDEDGERESQSVPMPLYNTDGGKKDETKNRTNIR